MWFKDRSGLERDRQLFRQAEEIMGEEDFEFLFTTLRTERSYFTLNRGKMLQYLKFLEDAEAAFGDRRLQEKRMALAEALRDLKAHTGAHFLAFPRNQTGENVRFCLHPDYFILEATDVSIEEHNFFLKAERRLGEYLARAVTRYEEFRALAGKKLKL